MPPENDINLENDNELGNNSGVLVGQPSIRTLHDDDNNNNEEETTALGGGVPSSEIATNAAVDTENSSRAAMVYPEGSSSSAEQGLDVTGNNNSNSTNNISVHCPRPPTTTTTTEEVSGSSVHEEEHSLRAATVVSVISSPAAGETAAHASSSSVLEVAAVMREGDEEEKEEEKREINFTDTHNTEEEKEEIIPELASMPTYAFLPPDDFSAAEQATVLGEPARVVHEDIDPWQQAAAEDAELVAMKRMAAYGGGGEEGITPMATTIICSNDDEAPAAPPTALNDSNDASSGSSQQQQVTELEPLPGEDALDFYKRNRDFWTINAAESLISQSKHVSIETLKLQGMSLAKDYWKAAQEERSRVGRGDSSEQTAAASVAAASLPENAHQSSSYYPGMNDSASQTQMELGPLAGETAASFSSRTHNFWTMQAAESLVGRNAPVSVPSLHVESARLAQEYYDLNQQLEQHTAAENSAQQATIVEITDEDHLHPLEMSRGAVQAEFVGQDFSRSASILPESTTEAVAVGGVAAVDDGAYGTAVVAESNQAETTTEATVIDSAPLAKEESQAAWRETEEAQVIADDSTTPFLDDRKPPAVDRVPTTPPQTDGIAVADQEAEVLAIQEEIHPSEFVEQEAQAQVVGQDYAYAGESASVEPTAVVTDEQVPSALVSGDDVVTATATATPDEDQAVEFHAVASPIATEEHGQVTEVHPVACDDTSPPEQSQATDVQAVVSATVAPEQRQEAQVHAITSHALSPEQNQAREIHAVVVEHAPPAQPSAAASAYVNPFEDDPQDSPAMSRDALAALDSQYDDSWMRVPSHASQDLPPVAVLATAHQEQDARRLEDVSDNTHGDSMGGNPPPIPPARAHASDSAIRTSSASAGSENSSSHRMHQLHNLSGNLARSTGGVMEVLFGEAKTPFAGKKSPVSQEAISNAVLPRTLLPWSVIYSDVSKMWVVTIQCSQKALESGHNKFEASKALRAFSLPTEKQARSLGLAWTPPRMLPFADTPVCHLCAFRFAVFRRACHCRNCGVCICKDCAVQWPQKMIPETYNTKRASTVNVCKSCDWLCNAFRLALLVGDMDQAVALHATGNINLTSPFNNVKGEVFFPVHAASLGGNLELLRWLVDEHCCPIKSVRLSGVNSSASDRYTPIVTSKGRSLLGIAMANNNVHMVRYLVVKKKLSISAERDITPAMVLQNLETVLPLIPDMTDCMVSDVTDMPAEATQRSLLSPAFASVVEGDYNDVSPIPPSVAPFQNGRTLSQEARDFGAILQHRPIADEGDNDGGGGENHEDDECIICYDAKIDCVATPCGHQMCCLKCSNNISRCPVCAQDCEFMRVFRS